MTETTRPKAPVLLIAAAIKSGKSEAFVNSEAARLGITAEAVQLIRADIRRYGNPMLRTERTQ